MYMYDIYIYTPKRRLRVPESEQSPCELQAMRPRYPRRPGHPTEQSPVRHDWSQRHVLETGHAVGHAVSHAVHRFASARVSAADNIPPL